ncbi:hypothetical protein BSFA1_80780 (plasmid) [Burkholderia sp. SFA1]|nr:hypothetical protein BYI23_E001710 [Burkholderia sp. YI23]BBQ02950.1 hypothetical protein BSFA1_80780 [Burkholderia sp. SFA1]
MGEANIRRMEVERVLTQVSGRQMSAREAANKIVGIVIPLLDSIPAGDPQKARASAWIERVLVAEPTISVSALSERCIGLGDLSGPINGEIGNFAGRLRLLATLDPRLDAIEV